MIEGKQNPTLKGLAQQLQKIIDQLDLERGKESRHIEKYSADADAVGVKSSKSLDKVMRYIDEAASTARQLPHPLADRALRCLSCLGTDTGAHVMTRKSTGKSTLQDGYIENYMKDNKENLDALEGLSRKLKESSFLLLLSQRLWYLDRTLAWFAHFQPDHEINSEAVLEKMKLLLERIEATRETTLMVSHPLVEKTLIILARLRECISKIQRDIELDIKRAPPYDRDSMTIKRVRAGCSDAYYASFDALKTLASTFEADHYIHQRATVASESKADHILHESKQHRGQTAKPEAKKDLTSEKPTRTEREIRTVKKPSKANGNNFKICSKKEFDQFRSIHERFSNFLKEPDKNYDSKLSKDIKESWPMITKVAKIFEVELSDKLETILHIIKRPTLPTPEIAAEDFSANTSIPEYVTVSVLPDLEEEYEEAKKDREKVLRDFDRVMLALLSTPTMSSSADRKLNAGDKWMKVSEAAVLAGVAPGTISRAASEGAIENNGVKGTKRRIKKSSLLLWMEERNQRERQKGYTKYSKMLDDIPDKH